MLYDSMICTGIICGIPTAPRLLSKPITPGARLGHKLLLHSSVQFQRRRNLKPHSSRVVCAQGFNFPKVIQTAWKVGNDAIEAGTKLVPVAIPRPIARIFVTIAAVATTLFVLKSFVSTALFALAVMGLSYFIFIALNKEEGPKGNEYDNTSSSTTSSSSSVEDSLEEARRIMDKYK